MGYFDEISLRMSSQIYDKLSMKFSDILLGLVDSLSVLVSEDYKNNNGQRNTQNT